MILLIFVYHQICALRNFYLGIYTSSEVKIKNDYKTKTTICKRCGIERPIRSHHCSICNKCIERMDHHCYFMNNCIGKKNYKYFFRYLLLSLINAFGAIFISGYRFYIFNYFEYGTIKKSMKLKILIGFLLKIIFLSIISIPTIIGTAYLLIYHLFLIYKNQTTIERIYPKLYVKEESIDNKSFCGRLSDLIECDNLLNIYILD